MAKGKSSASSATRKKHARKAAVASGELPLPKEKKQKGKEKGKKGKEPRKKVYIPPVKPAPVRPDPLDTLGIARILPAELLVILRKLAKKDSVTKRRALEDLQADWIENARKDESRLSAVAEALPVWLHHVPTLFLHPSRRIRLLSVSLHASLLSLPSPVPERLSSFPRDVADADQAEYLIGAWCLAAFDVDRQVATYARESWNKTTTLLAADPAQGTSSKKLQLDQAILRQLWDLVNRTALDPLGVYAYVNPPQPAAPPPPSQRKGGKPASAPAREDDGSGRVKGDEDDESEADRRARLRISAFGAAEWVLNAYFTLIKDDEKLDEFVNTLDNAALWSALHHGQAAPFVQDELESFGYNQPGVRRSAWAFLLAVVQNCRNHIQSLLPTLSAAALRSAWVDPDPGVRGAMWQPLMTFLKAHPSAWQIASAPPADAGDEEDESASDDDEEPSKPPGPSIRQTGSLPYQEFRQFLETGCMGSPTSGYPAILVVLSTIPTPVLASVSSPMQTLFTSFWAAVDARALSGLDRTSASASFLSSVLECSVFMARRLLASDGKTLLGEDENDARATARAVVCEQVKRAWEELSAQRLKLDEKRAAEYLARTLSSVYHIDEDLASAVWETLATSVRGQMATRDQPVPTLLASILQVFRTAFARESSLAQANEALAAELIHSVIAQLEKFLAQDEVDAAAPARVDSFVSLLNVFGRELFSDAEIVASIDKAFSTHAYRLLVLSPSILSVYLASRGDGERVSALWHGLLRAAAEHEDRFSTSLSALVDLARDNSVENALRPSGDVLDSAVARLLVTSSSGAGGAQSYTLLKGVLRNPDPFISRGCFNGVISSICSTFSQHVQDCLRGEASPASAIGLLDLLQAVVKKDTIASLPTETLLAVLPDVFIFTHVVPLLDAPASGDLPDSAKLVVWWQGACAEVPGDLKANVFAIVKSRLRDILNDCSVRTLPATFIALLEGGLPDFDVDILHDIFPSKDEMHALLDALPGQPASVSLAVLDPLVFAGEWKAPSTADVAYDHRGYSSYGRIVTAILSYFTHRRDVARDNIWALRHFYALALYAKDLLDVPSARSPVFNQKASHDSLNGISSKVDQLAAYLLSGDYVDGWLSQVAVNLSQKKTTATSHGVEQLLSVLVGPQRESNAFRESRILRTVLRHLFAGASKEDAEQFLRLARTLEKSSPHASLAIIFAVTQYAPEPPGLDRLRNELAANMLGVPPSKANSEGLWLLRRLAAVAPDPESDIVYLPTPRAVNLMKVCQQWITSDEDLDEGVDSEMIAVFLHLLPILQNVPGSHWDLIYDVVENNLENCSLDESSTLPLLSRTLKVVIAIQDLVSTNKALRASWDERKTPVLTMVRELVAKRPSGNQLSPPLSACRELVLTVVQDLPSSLIGNDTLSKMCHLVTDASEAVPQMAYKLLQEAAHKRTEHMVVEASIDTEEPIQLDLPEELIALLGNSFLDQDGDERTHNHNLFGYLLTWMLVFDLFTNASLKVKSGYTDHLRRLDLVSERFLPHIFTILQLYGGATRPIKLDVWEVDEYYLELYSADAAISLSLLAAHLYYRALLLVPALIRSWLSDCRDRQLSLTVTNYTSSYFSPAIVRAELAQVKDPSHAAELSDENFTIKIANAVNEITAAFAVDEYSLELKLKLPSDFPLHTIITKDSTRVGVTEDRWRSWILGVQQILTYRSGSIVDGLGFFKKNVTSHFEGLSECAICYSMISAMDGSLPKKPCKTCKNRFHAGCLYKWFNTSHSSSCPLCRSEIIQ